MDMLLDHWPAIATPIGLIIAAIEQIISKNKKGNL